MRDNDPVTETQIKLMYELTRLNRTEFAKACIRTYGKRPENFTLREANIVINNLRRNGVVV